MGITLRTHSPSLHQAAVSKPMARSGPGVVINRGIPYRPPNTVILS